MPNYDVDKYLDESVREDRRKVNQIAGVGIAGILIILFACVCAIVAVVYSVMSYNPDEYHREFIEECHENGGRVSYSSRGEFHCIESGVYHE